MQDPESIKTCNLGVELGQFQLQAIGRARRENPVEMVRIHRTVGWHYEYHLPKSKWLNFNDALGHPYPLLQSSGYLSDKEMWAVTDGPVPGFEEYLKSKKPVRKNPRIPKVQPKLELGTQEFTVGKTVEIPADMPETFVFPTESATHDITFVFRFLGDDIHYDYPELDIRIAIAISKMQFGNLGGFFIQLDDGQEQVFSDNIVLADQLLTAHLMDVFAQSKHVHLVFIRDTEVVRIIHAKRPDKKTIEAAKQAARLIREHPAPIDLVEQFAGRAKPVEVGIEMGERLNPSLRIVFDLDETLGHYGEQISEAGFGIYEFKLRPGATRLLQDLKTLGHMLILWSTGDDAYVKEVVEKAGWASLFSEVYGRSMPAKTYKDIRKIEGDVLIENSKSEQRFGDKHGYDVVVVAPFYEATGDSAQDLKWVDEIKDAISHIEAAQPSTNPAKMMTKEAKRKALVWLKHRYIIPDSIERQIITQLMAMPIEDEVQLSKLYNQAICNYEQNVPLFESHIESGDKI